MCLIAFALTCHPRYRLVLAANRDESFCRPTASATYWEVAPQILAGRDLEAGGTWLGVTTTGRIAAITNYRERPGPGTSLPSRGGLVAAFLSGGMSRDDYRQILEREGRHYGGFNLIVGDHTGFSYWSNRGAAVAHISPGCHGLSNHLLDTPWPKVIAARGGLERLLRSEGDAQEALFTLLDAPGPFADELMPAT